MASCQTFSLLGKEIIFFSNNLIVLLIKLRSFPGLFQNFTSLLTQLLGAIIISVMCMSYFPSASPLRYDFVVDYKSA